jgi:hypothetical protein
MLVRFFLLSQAIGRRRTVTHGQPIIIMAKLFHPANLHGSISCCYVCSFVEARTPAWSLLWPTLPSASRSAAIYQP